MSQHDIRLLGFDPRPEPAPQALQRLFGMRQEAAARLVASLPRVVKRNVPAAEAARIAEALRGVGGHVELLAAEIVPGSAVFVSEPPAAPTAMGTRDTVRMVRSEMPEMPDAPVDAHAATMVGTGASTPPPPSTAATATLGTPPASADAGTPRRASAETATLDAAEVWRGSTPPIAAPRPAAPQQAHPAPRQAPAPGTQPSRERGGGFVPGAIEFGRAELAGAAAGLQLVDVRASSPRQPAAAAGSRGSDTDARLGLGERDQPALELTSNPLEFVAQGGKQPKPELVQSPALTVDGMQRADDPLALPTRRSLPAPPSAATTTAVPVALPATARRRRRGTIRPNAELLAFGVLSALAVLMLVVHVLTT